jgi:hypothetical protein
MGRALDTVIEVMFHLEELDYVHAAQVLACLLGLDYEKAYDRVHRVFFGYTAKMVHGYIWSSQLGTSWNQLLCSDTRQPAGHQATEQCMSLSPTRAQPHTAHGKEGLLFPLIDDTLDPIGSTAGADASPAGCKAWQRAFHKRLPWPTRVFAWRLLHGALRCGGATAAFLPPGDPDLQGARCKNPGCNVLPVRPLETLRHLFMECALAERAVEWLCALWSQLAPNQQAPPCLPHVILADDASAWAPSQQVASLWGFFRLTMLKRIWLARCELVENGSGASACSTPGIVCVFVQEIRALIQQDWLRVVGDVRQLGGVCPSWFRGRDPYRSYSPRCSK